MKKIRFFYLLNRKYKAKNILLFLVFLIAGIIVSTSLLTQKNNHIFYETQISKIAETETAFHMEETQMLQEFQLVSNSVNDVLNFFSMASILIAIWGSVTLLLFKDISMQKNFVVCKIYGMQPQDMLYKAFVDFLQNGVLAGVIGTVSGFGLFIALVKKICGINHMISIFSRETMDVLLFVVLLLGIVSFLGSLISGIFVYEKPEANILYERKAKYICKKTIYIALIGLALLYLLIGWKFGNTEYLKWMIGVLVVVVGMLSGVFYFIFHVLAQKHRNRKALTGIMGLSYRFLCTRHKRDGILAATISVGAILLCFIMNIEFNFSSILRDSYRDNMGYSVVVRADSWDEGVSIMNKLDENGFTYTEVFSKLINYSELSGCQNEEGKLWMGVVGNQTDGNEHFQVSFGSFRAENYCINRLALQEGYTYAVLGNELLFEQRLSDNQGLSLINYNILVNAKDWGFAMDHSWHRVYLLDISVKQEKELKLILADVPCSIETASQITDEINRLMNEYLVVVSAIGTMLVLVTGTFFYCMIQNDLLERKKELFLYQIYGASSRKAVQVIFMEYVWIAISASFSVVFVIMFLGELFFLYMLQRHYPLSVVVVLLTTAIVSSFVFGCCILAEKITYKGRTVEMIRDE